MKPVAPVRNTLKFGLLYVNPWTARTRVKDILRVVIWARHNGVKVRRLHPEQIDEALSRAVKDESRTPRLRIYNAYEAGQ